MSRREYAIGLMALLAWTAVVAGGAAGFTTLLALDRFVAAPGGALALCEIVTTQ